MIRLIVIGFVIGLMRCDRVPESKVNEDRIACEKTDYDELKAEIYQIKLQMLEYHGKLLNISDRTALSATENILSYSLWPNKRTLQTKFSS